MASKGGHLKLFYLEYKKEGSAQTVTDATFAKWQGCVLSNIRKEQKSAPFVVTEWGTKKAQNRGLNSDTAVTDA